MNIAILEFYPILLAVRVWGHLWRNHAILFFTDNESLVPIINKQTSTDTTLLQMVRWLVLACLQLNILFKAKHILGKNKYLSRFSFSFAGASFSQSGAICARETCAHSTELSSPPLLQHVEDLLTASSSQRTYKKAWSTFHAFTTSYGINPTSAHMSPSHIAPFIAYLQHQHCAPKTMSTYLSAVAYVHKLLNKSDPTESCLVRKLVLVPIDWRHL